MKIYLMDDNAFVRLNDSNYMICVGKKTEVDAATPERLIQMVREAVALSMFNSIATSKGQAKH